MSEYRYGVLWALGLGLLMGCAGSGEADHPPASQPRAVAGFQHAYVHGDCAPWDGPATRIVLQNQAISPSKAEGQLPQETFPLYAISLWTRQPALGRWIELDPDVQGQTGGRVVYCPEQGRCESLEQARVRLERADADGWEGELRLKVGDGSGRELVYPFHAGYVSVRYFCG